jgi:hypothetical protein
VKHWRQCDQVLGRPRVRQRALSVIDDKIQSVIDDKITSTGRRRPHHRDSFPCAGTRRFGRSGLQVSALGMGCWAIGGAMAAGEQMLETSARPAGLTSLAGLARGR